MAKSEPPQPKISFLRKVSILIAVVGVSFGLILRKLPNLRGVVPFLVYKQKFNHVDIPSLNGQVALVTGANSGLGFETATALAENGAKVFMTCRSMAKCEGAAKIIRERVPHATLDLIIMDLNDLDSVQTAAYQVISQTDQLDILVLNAGMMFAEYGLSKQGLETQFAVNHVAHFYFTAKLTPLLRQSAPATVTVVSSMALAMSYPHRMALTEEVINDEAIYDSLSAYGQSKLANLFFGHEYAERELDNGIYCNIIHPGYVDTNLGHLLADQLVGYGVPRGLIDGFFGIQKYFVFDSKTAALTQLYTAVSPDIVNHKISGRLFYPIADQIDPATVQPAATNLTLQKGLWTLTESLLADRGFNDY